MKYVCISTEIWKKAEEEKAEENLPVIFSLK